MKTTKLTKLNERVKRFSFTPFPYTMNVVVTNDIAASVLRRRRQVASISPDPYCAALTLGGEETPFSYIFLSEHPSLLHIAHEVSHVIWFFMRFIGAKPENEFIAYYTGHYVQEVARFAMISNKN